MHADQINTPRAITDTQGTVVWRWESDAFGVGAPDQDPDSDGQQFVYNLRFPGQYVDSETELHYNYFRDYEPSLGRYVQSDPIGLEGGSNTYAYVGGNPLQNVDPEGLDYWVEGPVPSEAGYGYHQSICVGMPGGKRTCISFGRKPGQGDCWFDCKGHVNRDTSAPGPVDDDYYRQTDAKTDRKIKNYLEKQIGTHGRYDVLGGENCRSFSQDTFDDLVNTYGGQSGVPSK